MNEKALNKILRVKFNNLAKKRNMDFVEQYGWEVGLNQTHDLEGFNEWLENEVLK